MELPVGIQVNEGDGVSYILRLNKSLYGLKQASANWFEFLKKGLEDRGYISSRIDQCAFYKEDSIVLVYVDDCIVISSKK